MPSPRVDFKYIRTHPNVSFETVAAHYGLSLEKGGADPEQKKTLCPFHDDQKPSLNINLEKRNFHCFACGAKGNVLDFVALIQQIEIRPAAIALAEICGVETAAPSGGRQKPTPAMTPLERIKARQGETSATSSDEEAATDNEESEVDTETPADPQQTEDAFQPYTRTLPLDANHSYLKERGLSSETIADFELGFCKAGYQRGRIAIRLHDIDGNPLGYAGRWAETAPPDDTSRYLLPKNFPKETVLFNAHRINRGEDLILVESYWSVFRLWQLGEHQVVSLMGWSLSDRHIELLRELNVQRVLILFDGDAAGREATAAAIEKLVGAFYVRAPEVPDGFKPHSADESLLRKFLEHT